MPPTQTSTGVGKDPVGGAWLSGDVIGPIPVANIVTTCPGLAEAARELAGWLDALTKLLIAPEPMPSPVAVKIPTLSLATYTGDGLLNALLRTTRTDTHPSGALD